MNCSEKLAPRESCSNAVNLLHTANCIVLVLLTTLAAAQSQQALSADLARYYFASPEAEVAARADLAQTLKSLQSYEGHLDNGPNLFLALQAYEKVQTLYRRHDGYLHLRCARNREDKACEDEQKAWVIDYGAIRIMKTPSKT